MWRELKKELAPAFIRLSNTLVLAPFVKIGCHCASFSVIVVFVTVNKWYFLEDGAIQCT
jgi:hypothetical protein